MSLMNCLLADTNTCCDAISVQLAMLLEQLPKNNVQRKQQYFLVWYTHHGKGISHVNQAVVNFNVNFFDVNMDISHGKFIAGKSGHTHIYHSKIVPCNRTYWLSCKSS